MKKKIHTFGYAYLKMMYNKLVFRINKMFIDDTFSTLSKSKQIKLLNKLATTAKQIGCFDLKQATKIALLGLGISFTGNVFAQNPTFVQKTGSDNPFDGVNLTSVSAPTFADLDGDGDLDACVGESSGKVILFQNIGTANTPLLSNLGNIISTQDAGLTFPTFVDIDNDGDKDAYVFGTHYEYNSVSGKMDENRSLMYYPNNGTVNIPNFDNTPNSTIGETVNNSSTIYYPAFVDIDNDGDKDLFMGLFDGSFRFYENNGTASNPNLVETNTHPLSGVNAGFVIAPVFVDFDQDGDQDLVVGDYYGGLKYYKNTGNASNANFELQSGVDNPFDGLNFTMLSTPTFADIDGDGDQDLFVGEYSGKISYFENSPVLTVLENNVNSNLFSLYPNPATDKLNIRLQELSSGSVSILDMNGNVLKSQQLNGLESTISTSNLVNGTYLVKISVENNSSTKLLTILK